MYCGLLWPMVKFFLAQHGLLWHLNSRISQINNQTMQFKCIHIYWSVEQKFEQIQVVIENKTRRKTLNNTIEL